MASNLQKFTRLYKYNVFNVEQYFNLLLLSSTRQPYKQVCCFNTTKVVTAWKRSDGNKIDKTAPENITTNPRKMTITLHDQDDNLIGHFTKSDADKMARDLNLRLVCVRDVTEPQKMYYKFMTGAKLHEERLKTKQEKKEKQMKREVKIIAIKSKIAAHDLTTRLNTIAKWLTKNHEVQLTVEGENDKEKIVDAVQKHILEIGKFKSQTSKTGRTIISIHPVSSQNMDEEIKDES